MKRAKEYPKPLLLLPPVKLKVSLFIACKLMLLLYFCFWSIGFNAVNEAIAAESKYVDCSSKDSVVSVFFSLSPRSA